MEPKTPSAARYALTLAASLVRGVKSLPGISQETLEDLEGIEHEIRRYVALI